MYKFFISICLVLIFSTNHAQESLENNEVKDSIVYKSPYGLRLGVDLSKPIKGFLDDTYQGFEIVGDYRISKNFFIAAELGYEEENTREDYTNSTANGTYVKVGFNYNAYKNWENMNNEIFLGMRYGLSSFNQTLNNFTPNVSDPDFGNYFNPPIINSSTSEKLTSQWTELVVGIKVETLKNTFIGLSVSYKILMSVTEPANFQALYAPGFNRIFASDTGFGFNYTISYLIPFTKK